jgi:hypothetical protein
MFKVEVIADSTGTWCGNAVRFPTSDEAAVYATDLLLRWTAVHHWRVVNCETGAVEVQSR